MLIKRPVITEKSMDQYAKERKVTFELDLKATKNEAKKMLEKVYEVEVENAWVINRLGKLKRNRITRKLSKTADRKFGIFQLAEGSKIDIFEK